MVNITLDFTGGQNIKLEDSDELVASTVIKPMTSQIVAVIRAYDVTWTTPCKIKLSKRSPAKEEQEGFIKDSVE